MELPAKFSEDLTPSNRPSLKVDGDILGVYNHNVYSKRQFETSWKQSKGSKQMVGYDLRNNQARRSFLCIVIKITLQPSKLYKNKKINYPKHGIIKLNVLNAQTKESE